MTPYNLPSNSFGDSNIQPLPKVKYNVCNFYILCYVTYVTLLCWYCYFGTLKSMNFEHCISNYSLNFTHQIYMSLMLCSNQHFI